MMVAGADAKWGTSAVQRYVDPAPGAAPPPAPPSSHASYAPPPPPPSHALPPPASKHHAAVSKCGANAWAAMASTASRSPAASVLGAQFLVVFLVLSLLRPPFVMRARTPVDVPRLNPRAAAAVAAASVGATLLLVRRAALKA